MGIMLLKLSGIRECVIRRRLNRFVVEALMEGRVERLHNTNTGRLLDLLVEGRRCVAEPISGRKLMWRLVAVEDTDYPGKWDIVSTLAQNRAFEAAVGLSLLPYVKGCEIVSRNPRVGPSLLDYLLVCGGRPVYVETKSAVLRGPGGEAMYPDCPTARGVRHVRELVRLVKEGKSVLLLFIAAMPGPRCFRPYREGDPELSAELEKAILEGVTVKALSIYGVVMGEELAVVLENPELPLCPEWLAEVTGTP